MAVLLMLLGLAVYVLVVGWSSAGEPGSDISTAGYVAMVLGIVVTLALGIGLMAVRAAPWKRCKRWYGGSRRTFPQRSSSCCISAPAATWQKS